MTTAHTPGPWGYRNSDRSPVALVPATDGPALAMVYLSDPGTRKRTPEYAANAALLAAAPDLLAAAKAALECIERHVPATTFAPRDMLRAAIALTEIQS